MRLSDQEVDQYKEDGFIIVRGLFDPTLAGQMRDHFMKLRAQGPRPGDYGGTTDHMEDANHKYPRLKNMHEWDTVSTQWSRWHSMLAILEQLLEDKPVIYQSMIYFKSPGARGQALHQDQNYLAVDPIIGVWVALDKSVEPVGLMTLVPGSHRYGLLSVETADTSISFTDQQVVLPEGTLEPIRADMQPGDGLFWDGKIVHGSAPNTTTNCWRRSFICHFTSAHAKKFEPPPDKLMSIHRK